MNWYEKLYIGKNAKKKASAYIQKIEEGRFPFQVYLITLASGTTDQMEIMEARNLKFWYTRKKCPLIVGLAQGKAEALEVLQQITEDVLNRTGTPDFRMFFLSEPEDRFGGRFS